MSDALTARAAREYRDERDRQERTKGVPRLAMPHLAPPPQSEGDYGEQAPPRPLDGAEPERAPGRAPSTTLPTAETPNPLSSRRPHSHGASHQPFLAANSSTAATMPASFLASPPRRPKLASHRWASLKPSQ